MPLLGGNECTMAVSMLADGFYFCGKDFKFSVKGMQLVKELEKDLKVANVICMNGRRHLTSSMNEVSRDLIVTSNSKRKQALLDMLPILTELRHALDMQVALESHVEDGNYFKAFQVLPEYLQLLDSLSELSAIQELSRGVEVWLGKTLQKLDSLLLGVCQEFKDEGYINVSISSLSCETNCYFLVYAKKLKIDLIGCYDALQVVDAYALIGDVSGLAEKMQSFFMQEVLSETHSVLKNIVQEDQEAHMQSSRLMSSYYAIMSFQLENKVLACQTSNVSQKRSDIAPSGDEQQIESVTRDSCRSKADNDSLMDSVDRMPISSSVEESMATTVSFADAPGSTLSVYKDSNGPVDESRNDGSEASSSGSPWYQLRKDAIAFVSQTLQRGRKNLWQLTTSRVSVLLSSAAACSTSIHQFLRNYEDLNVFILAGEAFCGVEAVEFRMKLKTGCENYFVAFHRQSLYIWRQGQEVSVMACGHTWLAVNDMARGNRWRLLDLAWDLYFSFLTSVSILRILRVAQAILVEKLTPVDSLTQVNSLAFVNFLVEGDSFIVLSQVSK
ncbi:hypothetical protein CK203_004738 [Vitis vinifera]|uniref:Vacuolar protein sorting-associated protein 54 N-terminal domain-containing protein n=1 Tax=Vitis vinifera TaxID=29760 RepID=A0A438KFW0_VITVI|nr:hypothetical protein CK203_004738 [Vitis vinifera]